MPPPNPPATPDSLVKQIAAEMKELESAPKIPISQFQPKQTAQQGRCSWCGRYSNNLVYVDTIHGQERYKCDLCGGRHA